MEGNPLPLISKRKKGKTENHLGEGRGERPFPARRRGFLLKGGIKD